MLIMSPARAFALPVTDAGSLMHVRLPRWEIDFIDDAIVTGADAKPTISPASRIAPWGTGSSASARTAAVSRSSALSTHPSEYDHTKGEQPAAHCHV